MKKRRVEVWYYCMTCFLEKGVLQNASTIDRKPIFPWAYVKAHYLIYGQEYIFSNA